MPAFTPPTTAAHVRVTASAHALPDSTSITIRVRIDRGFHINANPASDPELIATTVTGDALEKIVYPPPHVITTVWSHEKLAVYDDAVTIEATSRNAPHSVVVRAQACTAHVCLRPSDIRVPVISQPPR